MMREFVINTQLLKRYYSLTKPGIIYGNAITAAGGFFLAARGNINGVLLLETLAGLSLIVGSACVFNNLIDQDIDAVMKRTKKRVLVKGLISIRSAVIYGALLGVLGTLILSLFVNFLALAVALVGLFFYVIIYTYFKRRTVHGTMIGCISGAAPPVVGYTAVMGHLDGAALLLFLILVFWQMPHFYAIAIYRVREYASANIPVVSVVKGVSFTKIVVPILVAVFTGFSVGLTFLGYAGYLYLAIALALGVSWFGIGVLKFNALPNDVWARKMFRYSLVVITVWCLGISVDSMTR